ncbi:hypothetical protein [Haloarcula litorea]|uniref:hypothetical protein n=1 Tax=Haloarcula litorea TaxID=3032579 RepID=UPI0023E75D59|nr:hypothetical protein [Halomicroarcula sp. GDY20]
MDRLSSCYFCGAALDASLSEYPVVPSDLGPTDDEQRTVVLCPTCRRKVGSIVEPIVATLRADDAPAANDDDQSGLIDESGLDPQPDPDAVGDANETAEGDLLDGGDGEPSDDGSLLGGDPDDERASTATDAGRAGADDEPAGGSDDADEGRTQASSDDDPALTRLEYNKVMRLLQNRQLPVERAEIRDVATSAYEISPREFDAVIDAAVERDLIAEDDGRLVQPE